MEIGKTERGGHIEEKGESGTEGKKEAIEMIDREKER